jgi:hypothetical protein
MVTELEEVPMSIVGGLDIHRKQLTFDYVDQDTGRWEPGATRNDAGETSAHRQSPTRAHHKE